MSLPYLARYALSLSPQTAVSKAARFGARMVRSRLREVLWRHRETYAPPEKSPVQLMGLLGGIAANPSSPDSETLRTLCDHVLAHRFNLLGSGWTEVLTSADHAASVSAGNRERSAAIGHLIDIDYRPIDWQLDFKSGYRWREDRLSGSLAYGHKPGVDVKVPWELARCQHLPWLGCQYIADSSERWASEFRNQVLDFAATNPPGYGVNWMCSMDVGIRAANLVLAYDLFCSSGMVFDAPFCDEFHCLIVAHGRHIFSNLEWSENHRGNHYLANLAGLLFVAAYLPSSPENDGWLAFAGKEFIAEIERQFTDDGANFEASTSYHRLSAEMAAYGTALLLGMKGSRSLDVVFPSGYFDWLQRMAEFSMHCTKPNGRVVQVGDNDSGRLFRLCPSFDLDHRATVAAINGLFGRADLAQFAGEDTVFEGHVVSLLAGRWSMAGTTEPAALNRFPERTKIDPSMLDVAGDIQIVPPDPSALQGLTAFSYPGFGLYGWRSDRFFLSVRCGPIGQNGNGGHAHNDQLAVELNIDGEDWISDPGTGVYTASPDIRDAYRSAKAHFVPGKDAGEPASLKLGLFRLEDRAKAERLEFSSTSFEGRHFGYAKPVHRRVVIDDRSIRITDSFVVDGGNRGATVVPEAFSNGETLRQHLGLDIAFSPGYGLYDEP